MTVCFPHIFQTHCNWIWMAGVYAKVANGYFWLETNCPACLADGHNLCKLSPSWIDSINLLPTIVSIQVNMLNNKKECDVILHSWALDCLLSTIKARDSSKLLLVNKLCNYQISTLSLQQFFHILSLCLIPGPAATKCTYFILAYSY